MQNTLFVESGDLDHVQVHDLGNAFIQEYPQAFTASQSAAYLDTLIHTIPWQQGSIRIGGRLIRVPRLQCWMGDEKSHYGYSGIRLRPVVWSDPVLDLRCRVEDLAGRQFNSVLLNYYRSGLDSVAWHSDGEKELGPDPVIASVSLGAERPFQLKPRSVKATGSSSYKMILRSGSVLIMGTGLQANWMHQLPKVKNLAEPRVNLTFRQIV